MYHLISFSPSPPPPLLIPLKTSLFSPSKPLKHYHPNLIKIQHASSIPMNSASATTQAHENEIAHDFSPFLRIYKNGAVERLKGTEIAPPSLDPKTQVQSKDVIFPISPTQNLSSRIYLPPYPNPNKKLPLLIYFHGGGFCVETPYSPIYHTHLNNLVSESNCVAVSVDYRLVPEQPLPIGYDDSWAAIEWVASHNLGEKPGQEEWLKLCADFDRVFLGGDSAGANIAHRMGIRNGEKKLVGANIEGIILVHPYFWGKDPIGNEAKEAEKRAIVDAVWHFACPNSTDGNDDPWINPLVDPNLGKMGCKKVIVIVAERDMLRDRGLFYYDKLKNSSGFGGSVEIMETEEEEHVFHLEKSESENAISMLQRIASFINQH